MMMWFLLIVLGGNSPQSGVAVDTRQTFATEAECIVSRDAVREVGASEVGGVSGRRQTAAYCIPRGGPAQGAR